MKEELSSAIHTIWAHWTKYILSICFLNDDGSFTIPKEKADTWLRQIQTDYKDLTEKEKDSDRDIVDKFLGFINKEK